MKIDNSVNNNTGNVSVTTPQTRTSKSVSKSSTGTTSSANVQTSTQLQGLESQVATSSAFDANKVEEIKAAIAGGQFQVDPGKVASGLINNVADLLQTQSQSA